MKLNKSIMANDCKKENLWAQIKEIAQSMEDDENEECNCCETCFPVFFCSPTALGCAPCVPCVPCTPATVVSVPMQPLTMNQTNKIEPVANPNPEDDNTNRYDNFYNNYNVDWHNKSSVDANCIEEHPNKVNGLTVDGKKPYCNNGNSGKNGKNCYDMYGSNKIVLKMVRPDNCYGKWQAKLKTCTMPKKVSKVNCENAIKIETCDVKKNESSKRNKGKGDEHVCVYDKPCRAHCFETPVEKRNVRYDIEDLQQDAINKRCNS